MGDRRASLRELTPSPAAGFDAPFAMLEACHERIQRTLDLLLRLRAHVARSGVDEQARQAARDVLRYFDQAAPQHHLDEELHVLPVLDASGDAALLALASRLRDDHRRMDEGWRAARPALADVAEGRLASLDAAQELPLVEFSALYVRHLAAEEEVAFPAASSGLEPAALEWMSRDMRQRRGVA
jgi:hemerythrin-like domain-containing protein